MKCATCRKPIGSTDRRRRYCSDFCRVNAKRSPRLRAVGDDERPAETKPGPRRLKVDIAAREGTDLELLMAMRDRVAEQVADPTCPPRDLASLTRRLEEIRKQIGAERERLSKEADDGDDVEDAAWDEEAI